MAIPGVPGFGLIRSTSGLARIGGQITLQLSGQVSLVTYMCSLVLDKFKFEVGLHMKYCTEMCVQGFEVMNHMQGVHWDPCFVAPRHGP